MAGRCLLYYITDRSQFAGNESERREAMLDKIAEAARAGVDYIQLRENDLSVREREALAHEAIRVIRELRTASAPSVVPRVLLNSRTDIALAAQLDGVHLRSADVSPCVVCSVWDQVRCGSPSVGQRPVIAVSCHSPSEILRAESEGADFAVFAPVFGKRNNPATPPQGIETLEKACVADIPVLALGGVTLQNAASCLKAGAAGIAGIRLFQENKIDEVVRIVRAL